MSIILNIKNKRKLAAKISINIKSMSLDEVTRDTKQKKRLVIGK